jgi:hypothetical protein
MDMLQGFIYIDNHGCVRGFTSGDGPYDKEVAKRLYESFSVGNTTDQEAYRVLEDVTQE